MPPSLKVIGLVLSRTFDSRFCLVLLELAALELGVELVAPFCRKGIDERFLGLRGGPLRVQEREQRRNILGKRVCREQARLRWTLIGA